VKLFKESSIQPPLAFQFIFLKSKPVRAHVKELYYNITLDFDFYQYFKYNTDMDKILFLLDQIIEKNVWEDSLTKKPEETGDNWNVHHLKLLKSLIFEYKNEKEKS